MTNSFIYMQLQTGDVTGAKEFYSQMFGWSVEEDPKSPIRYTEINTKTGPRAGLMSMLPADGQPKWLPYIGVETLDAAIEKLTQLGGSVLMPASKAGEKGTYAIVADPAGAHFALWESR